MMSSCQYRPMRMTMVKSQVHKEVNQEELDQRVAEKMALR